MIGWIVVWVLGVAAVLALWANRRYHWAAGWRYSWTRARHIVAEAPEPEYRFVDMYGSMVLAEEHYWLAAPTPLQAQYEAVLRRAGPDWREQTAADLAPEALDEEPGEWDDLWADDALMTSTNDSGPGASLVAAPGPVQAPALVSVITRRDGEGEGRAFHGLNHADTERLADTADVLDAHLLADVMAELRAQDDDAALYLSRLRSACAQARLDLAAVLA